MRSRIFLTPSAPGKPGVVQEIQFDDEAPRQFMEPVSPWAVNDAELSKLRSAVSDAETALRHAKSKNAGAAEITRLDKALTTAKRDLDIVEYELRRQRKREQVGADSPFSRNTAGLEQLRAMVGSAVAGVAALVKKSPLACNASPRCKQGAGYKCSRCRAA